MGKPEGGTCRRCGNGLRFVERRQGIAGSGGHHLGVHECPECEREVIGG